MQKLINFLKKIFNIKPEFPLNNLEEHEEIRLTYELHIKAINNLLADNPHISLYDIIDASIESHLEVGIMLKRVIYAMPNILKAKNVIQFKTIEWIIEDMLEAYSSNPIISLREYNESFMKAYCKRYVKL